MMRLCLILFWSCWLSGLAWAYPGERTALPVLTLTEARFIQDESPQPPALDDPRWRALVLPHFWREEAVEGHLGGWYQLRIPDDQGQQVLGNDAVQGVYLWRLHMNAAVWFNGTYIGDGGNMQPPVARNWNRPLYFTLPARLWQTENNVLLIRLMASPGYGLMVPPDLGPDSALRPAYDLRLLLQIDVSKALALLLAVVGAFMLGLWWQRRNDAAYLWFGLSCLCWAWLSAYLFVQQPPFSGEVFRWMAHSAADGWMACLAVFTFRYLREAHPRLEKLVLAVPSLASFSALLCLDAPLILFNIFRTSHAFSLLVGLGLCGYTLYRWFGQHGRDKKPEAMLLALTLGAIVLSGLHDWVLELPWEWATPEARIRMMREQFFMISYAAPLAFLFLTGHLVKRFVQAMNDLEALRDDLEVRVEAGRQALQQSFMQQRELERSQAAAEERERIYRDLHDDIGAKLLALVIGAENRLKADLARSALQDLRDVVSRSARGDTPLEHLCADWRAEIEQRLEEAEISLDWHQPDSLPNPVVRAGDALHLSRILREAITNAVKHGAGGHIRIEIGLDGQMLEVAVEDSGHGFVEVQGKLGRGLNNMRFRAEQLGGQIRWERSILGGCRVLLSIPGHRFIMPD